MSEVAGRMATQQGAKFLERPQNGYGILLGGVPGVKPANVIVLGGGVVGTQAAKMAAGLGANVTIFDISLDRLRKLDDIMPNNVNTQFSNTYNILKGVKNAHLIIGAVLVPGAKAPNLITKEMLKDINDGTVLVDVAVDQGGCFETTHPTTHKDPTYIIDNVLHYCVANIPGAVPVTSTEALTNATVSRGLAIANKGWKDACNNDLSLKLGLNIVNGKIVYRAVADAFKLDYTDIDQLI
jgi:alanine dehydrogenase